MTEITLAKLELVGALVNGEFVPVAHLYKRTYAKSDIIEPLYSNKMGRSFAVSNIRVKAAQSEFNALVRASKKNNLHI